MYVLSCHASTRNSPTSTNFDILCMCTVIITMLPSQRKALNVSRIQEKEILSDLIVFGALFLKLAKADK